MAEKCLPGFFRIETVLREHIRARRSCSPGVDQRRLDDPEFFRRSRDVAPRLIINERNGRVALQVSGIIGETIGQNLKYVRIDLNADNVTLAELQAP